MSMLSLALPGSAYLYQGEELGLPEVLDLPDDARQDPTYFRTEGAIKGRDGCRVPIPWSGEEPPYGFSTGTPWLPQPTDWAGLTAEAQDADPASTLALYRTALRIRRESEVLGDGELIWREPGTTTCSRSSAPATARSSCCSTCPRPSGSWRSRARSSSAPASRTYDDGGALVLAPESCTWIALP